jgi:salicylate hydroxylase
VSKLRVAIVGGGIGGVAAANALLQRGISVAVYEQARALAEVGAGVALHPNGVRALRHLGFGEPLARVGARWTDPQFRHPDGRLIAPWWPPDTSDTPEIYGVHRADLLDMLVSRLPPEVVHVDHRCSGFSQTSTHAALHFANGAQASADVVIGADGIHSTLQAYVTPPSPPIPAGTMAYRGVVSSASVGWPPGQMRNWLGNGKHFLVFPVRSNQLINYVGFISTERMAVESWSAPGDPAELARNFAGWDPLVQKILAQVETTFWWGLYDREPLPTWTNGRLTLLGDAAHPMLPHVGQGANQAVEDAVVLGVVLADADPSTAPAALQLYERIRRARTERMQLSSRANGARYDSAVPDLAVRDRELSNQVRDRAWMWQFDARADAEAALIRASGTC